MRIIKTRAFTSECITSINAFAQIKEKTIQDHLIIAPTHRSTAQQLCNVYMCKRLDSGPLMSCQTIILVDQLRQRRDVVQFKVPFRHPEK